MRVTNGIQSGACRLAGLLAALLIGFGVGRSAAQEPPKAASAVIRVQGRVDHPLSLTAEDLAGLPRLTVQATDHGGKRSEFAGVPLHEILKRAGAPLGERLRGKAAALYVLAGAPDGYRAVFALAELDPAFTDRVVLLADRRDGQPMGGSEGPFRIVVPGEKRQARWVRMVESLTVEAAGPASTGRDVPPARGGR